MKRLSFLVLGILFGVAAFCQTGSLPDSADMRIDYFGIPSQAPDPDFVKTQTARLNARDTYLDGIVDDIYPYHMFMFFSDSATSKTYSTSWASLTNTGAYLFLKDGASGFTMLHDSTKVTNAGVYEFLGSFTVDGDNTETVSLRFYNVSEAAAIPGVGAVTTTGANAFKNVFVLARDTISVGDTLVVQYNGSANGTAVFKHGSVLIKNIHE